MSKDFQLYAKAESVDADLGLVFGWGIICTEHGEPYFDTQGDHIPENSMLEAVSDFMKSARVSLDQHQGSQVGQVVHSFPMTKDIARAYGITCTKTGWMVAVKVPEDLVEKFKSGEKTGFSIGGKRIVDEVVEA